MYEHTDRLNIFSIQFVTFYFFFLKFVSFKKKSVFDISSVSRGWGGGGPVGITVTFQFSCGIAGGHAVVVMESRARTNSGERNTI